MFVKKVPVFQAGKVLTIEMLDALKNTIEAIGYRKYQGFSDGILNGFQVEVSEDYLTVDKGSIIFGEELYMVTEKTKVPYVGNGMMQLLVLRVGDTEKAGQFEIREAEIRTIREEDAILSDIEIARFRLQKGAKLRTNFLSLRDMSTAYDTVNLCNARWAAYGENSMAYPLLEMAAKEIEKKENADFYDELFLQAVYTAHGETVPLPLIDRYIKGKLGKSNIASLEARYRCLLEAVGRVESREGDARPRERRMGNNRIIVD